MRLVKKLVKITLYIFIQRDGRRGPYFEAVFRPYSIILIVEMRHHRISSFFAIKFRSTRKIYEFCPTQPKNVAPYGSPRTWRLKRAQQHDALKKPSKMTSQNGKDMCIQRGFRNCALKTLKVGKRWCERHWNQLGLDTNSLFLWTVCHRYYD